jgi:hypothetical protein
MAPATVESQQASNQTRVAMRHPESTSTMQLWASSNFMDDQATKPLARSESIFGADVVAPPIGVQESYYLCLPAVNSHRERRYYRSSSGRPASAPRSSLACIRTNKLIRTPADAPSLLTVIRSPSLPPSPHQSFFTSLVLQIGSTASSDDTPVPFGLNFRRS